MASKLRVDEITGGTGSTVSIGTATFTGGLSGDITGLNVTGVITATTLNQNVSGVVTATTFDATTSITVGNSVINSTSIGIGTTDTSGRNAGVGTAVGTLIFNSSVNELQVYSGPSGWISASSIPFTATGGTLDSSSRSGYNVHTFTGDGSFVVSGSPNTGCEILVVGGGGGGIKGGGGGGGVVYNNSISLGTGTYEVIVGGGGAAPGTQDANPGTLSSFIGGTVTYKGYGGGNGLQGPGKKGTAHPDGFFGSGGGGGEPNTPGGVYATPELQGASTQTPSPVTNNAGNQGGNGGPNSVGGGGGGAGGAGSNVPSGAGGPALDISISGSPVTYAGGGGGGGYPAGGMPDSGPADPSAGSNASGHPPGSANGTANRGGGAGGYENAPDGTLGAANGAGGSGIVIIAYPTA